MYDIYDDFKYGRHTQINLQFKKMKSCIVLTAFVTIFLTAAGDYKTLKIIADPNPAIILKAREPVSAEVGDYTLEFWLYPSETTGIVFTGDVGISA